MVRIPKNGHNKRNNLIDHISIIDFLMKQTVQTHPMLMNPQVVWKAFGSLILFHFL